VINLTNWEPNVQLLNAASCFNI